MSGYTQFGQAQSTFLSKVWGWITFIPLYIWSWLRWIIEWARTTISMGGVYGYALLITLIALSCWVVPLIWANIFQAKFAPKRDCSTCPQSKPTAGTFTLTPV